MNRITESRKFKTKITIAVWLSRYNCGRQSGHNGGLLALFMDIIPGVPRLTAVFDMTSVTTLEHACRVTGGRD